MKKWFSNVRWKIVLIGFVFTCVLMYPYLIRDFLPVEHDTFFHLSRIEGLAGAFRNGSFLPSVYPYKNNGFGYGSPLFYCDILLYPAAFLYIAGVSLARSYIFIVFIYCWISAVGMIRFAESVTKNEYAGYLAGAAFLYMNYRITDVYVRGALGELAAMAFLPFVLRYFYQILFENRCGQWKKFAFSLFLLSVSHNLTFAMTVVTLLIMFLCSTSHLTGEKIKVLAKGIFLAFILGSFYTIPMLEQTFSQRFYLHYYSKNSDLAQGAMDLWQYVVNRTVFGYSGNHLDRNLTMTVNIGLFLTFVPLLWLFVRRKKQPEDPFIMICLLIGYFFWILPCKFLPWDSFSFLRILQFPWRLNLIAAVLLCIPAAAVFTRLPYSRILTICAVLVLGGECIWHVSPVTGRTFGITSDTSYADILSGSLIDPYYSASYVRIECAGGEYLPAGSPDFREYPPAIRDSEGNITALEYKKNGSVLSFTVTEDYAFSTLELPLTYYKGYTVYDMTDGIEPCLVYENENGMVAFRTKARGKYMCMYVDTPLKRFCTWLSGLGLTFLYLSMFLKPKNDRSPLSFFR